MWGGKYLLGVPLADQRGIYLWTIQYQKEYYVDYIGETGKSFYDRNKEHIIQLLGGTIDF